MNPKLVKTQIAGFKMGMMQKIAFMKQSENILSNPWVSGALGLGAGAGLGIAGKKMYDRYMMADERTPSGQSPYIAEQQAAPQQPMELELTPEEYMQLMALYSQPGYSY